jgi:aminoglycoside phosphotransferase (APT) family kinase protein
MADVEGIREGSVTRWLSSELEDSQPPYEFELIAGGHSNLTYCVRDSAGARWVLRRPPLGKLLPTAHDMSREFRVLGAVRQTKVPVPTVVALCTDDSVNDAPFYLMEMVDGAVVRDETTAQELFTPSERRALGFKVADTLADIHEIDVTSVELQDLAKPNDYVNRQLKRWKRQIAQSKTRDLPILDLVGEKLETRVPIQSTTGLVHGDFRLDNCIIGLEGSIKAVLVWELCTLGDPLADVGQLMVYWTAPGEVLRVTADAPTAVEGFPTRDEMLARYEEKRGISLPDIDFYIAFSYWRLACITEGVFARYQHGDMGDRIGEGAIFEQRVLDLVSAADAITRSW